MDAVGHEDPERGGAAEDGSVRALLWQAAEDHAGEVGWSQVRKKLAIIATVAVVVAIAATRGFRSSAAGATSVDHAVGLYAGGGNAGASDDGTFGPLNCNAAKDNYMHEWSESKIQWCCSQEGVGCATWYSWCFTPWGIGLMVLLVLVVAFLAYGYYRRSTWIQEMMEEEEQDDVFAGCMPKEGRSCLPDAAACCGER